MKDLIIQLRQEGLSYNEISKKLGISKGIVSYHLTKIGLNKSNDSKGTKLSEDVILKINELNDGTITKKEIALKLGVSYGSVKRYTGVNVKVVKTEKELRDKQYQYHRNWRLNIKIKCIQYLGGKCSNCGYNRCVAALDLHHKDISQKEFVISGSNLKSFDKLIPELNKCEVLCSNCHREYHNPNLIDIL